MQSFVTLVIIYSLSNVPPNYFYVLWLRSFDSDRVFHDQVINAPLKSCNTKDKKIGDQAFFLHSVEEPKELSVPTVALLAANTAQSLI